MGHGAPALRLFVLCAFSCSVPLCLFVLCFSRSQNAFPSERFSTTRSLVRQGGTSCVTAVKHMREALPRIICQRLDNDLMPSLPLQQRHHAHSDIRHAADGGIDGGDARLLVGVVLRRQVFGPEFLRRHSWFDTSLLHKAAVFSPAAFSVRCRTMGCLRRATIF